MLKVDIKSMYEWPQILQFFIILPICFLLFYLAYFLDFSSLKKNLLDKQAQQTDLMQQLDMIFNQQIKLENELTQFNVYHLIMKEWQAKLVPSKKVPDLLNEILKIGTAKGLKFDELHPGDAIKEGDYLKVPIKIIAQGTYHQAANFVSDTSNLPLLVVVKSIDVVKPKIQDTQGKNLTEQAASKNVLTSELIFEVYDQMGNQANDKK